MKYYFFGLQIQKGYLFHLLIPTHFQLLFLTFLTAIMKNSYRRISFFIYCLTAIAFVFGFQTKLNAQDRFVTTYQYRRVPNDLLNHFI